MINGAGGEGATVAGAGLTGGGGGGTVAGAALTRGGGGTVAGAGEGISGAGGEVVGAGVVGAGMVTRAGRRGAMADGEAAPFAWPAGAPLLTAAREPDVSANARLIPPTATRTIKAEVISRRLVKGSLPSRVVPRTHIGWLPLRVSGLLYATQHRRVRFDRSVRRHRATKPLSWFARNE